MTQAAETTFDVIILGAGASGLVCASVAAGRGKSALLIDHAIKAGRKLSITGGGKCNLTNRIIRPQDYVGENPHFCRSAFSRFTPEDVLNLAREAGIELEEREQGQLFCKRSAKDLVNFLVRRCEQRGCRLLFEEHLLAVESIAPDGKDKRPSSAKESVESGETNGSAPIARAAPGAPRFRVRTRSGEYAAHSLVIAMGSPAWPQVGASGRGYELARVFGHRIVPIHPALVALVMPADWPLAGLAGISASASIRVLPPPETPDTANARGKRKKAEDAGILAADKLSLLFTHTGISGPAALQASLYWRKGCRLAIDFLPDFTPAELLDNTATGKLLCRNLLRRHLPVRLADALLPADLADKKVAELPRRERERLCALFKAHEVSPVGSEGFARAEAAAGGVSTEEISSRSMESARISGLFFCGEILDVTGRLGGYNLHWAFASGNAAGEHV